MSHTPKMFVVRLTGQLVHARTFAPVAGARILTLPRTAADSPEAVARLRAQLADQRAAKERGNTAVPAFDVVVCGGGVVSGSGVFDILAGSACRKALTSHPRPTHGIGALLVEFDDFESQLVNVPRGAWRPTLDDVELFATFDLGPIALPAPPRSAFAAARKPSGSRLQRRDSVLILSQR